MALLYSGEEYYSGNRRPYCIQAKNTIMAVDRCTIFEQRILLQTEMALLYYVKIILFGDQ